MKAYLLELNQIAERTLNAKGQHVETLYAKFIEGRERGFNFFEAGPRIDLIDPNRVCVEDRLSFEHCLYLIQIKEESLHKGIAFPLNMEATIQSTLKHLYGSQKPTPYFTLHEDQQLIVYINTDSIVDSIADKALNHH